MIEQPLRKRIRLKDDRWYAFRAGDLEILLGRRGEELSEGIRHYSGESEIPVGFSEVAGGLPEGAEKTHAWCRYLIGSEDDLEFLPAMPDRPVVLRPLVRRKLLPGNKARLLFFIPVWLQLYDVKKNSNSLISEYPTVVMSSTWFGDMQNGELCFDHETELLHEIHTPPHPSVNYTACVLNIQNSSHLLLDFFRMAVHVEHLTLYGDGKHLYTNEVSVNFTGTEQISQLKYSSRGPREIEPLQKMNGPRESASRSILKRSFSFIKQLSVV